MARPTPEAIGQAFALAPKEALDYLRSKGLAATDHWWNTWQDAHDRAFVVSKMTRLRLLSQTRQVVDDMLAGGSTLRVAAKELETEMRKAGWWGRQALADEAGGTDIVQIGSMHRINTILRTNMQTAYAAGRWRRQQEVRGFRPYWEYIAVIDGATRHSHRKLHGLVMRAGDPAWDAIYPPNGFNCRCRVRAITEREVRRRGLRATASDGIRDVVDRVGIDRRTGEAVERPGKEIVWTGADGRERAFRPDPGWSYNPGRNSPGVSAPPTPARAVHGQPTWRDAGLPGAAELPRAQPPPPLPAAGSRHDALVTLMDALGLDDASTQRRVRTPIGTVVLRSAELDHIVVNRRARRERYANRILPTLSDPDEVWITEYDDGSYRHRYLRFYRGRRRHALSIVTDGADGMLYNFIPTLSNTDINHQRRGNLLYRAARGGDG